MPVAEPQAQLSGLFPVAKDDVVTAVVVKHPSAPHLAHALVHELNVVGVASADTDAESLQKHSWLIQFMSRMLVQSSPTCVFFTNDVKVRGQVVV